jgi:hypothetical protein
MLTALRLPAAECDATLAPFDPERDHDEYVGGKPRYEGVP